MLLPALLSNKAVVDGSKSRVKLDPGAVDSSHRDGAFKLLQCEEWSCTVLRQINRVNRAIAMVQEARTRGGSRSLGASNDAKVRRRQRSQRQNAVHLAS
jgi:hypothetical protein